MHWWFYFLQTHRFLLLKMLTDGLEWCGCLVDYCDVFISCLDSHSDGTHSLQRIHKFISVKDQYSFSDNYKIQSVFSCYFKSSFHSRMNMKPVQDQIIFDHKIKTEKKKELHKENNQIYYRTITFGCIVKILFMTKISWWWQNIISILSQYIMTFIVLPLC